MDIDATQVITYSDEDTDNESPEEKNKVAELKVFTQKGIPETCFPIFEGENVIGRHGDSCQVHIPSKSLSKQHACITVSGESHLIYDKGSRNKTRRGKLFLAPEVRYELRDDDKLLLADIECQYSIVSQDLTVDYDSGPGSESVFVPSTQPMADVTDPDEQDVTLPPVSSVAETPFAKPTPKKTVALADSTQYVPESESDEDDFLFPQPRPVLDYADCNMATQAVGDVDDGPGSPLNGSMNYVGATQLLSSGDAPSKQKNGATGTLPYTLVAEDSDGDASRAGSKPRVPPPDEACTQAYSLCTASAAVAGAVDEDSDVTDGEDEGTPLYDSEPPSKPLLSAIDLGAATLAQDVYDDDEEEEEESMISGALFGATQAFVANTSQRDSRQDGSGGGVTLQLPDDQPTQVAVHGGATVQLPDDDATQVKGDDGGTFLLPDDQATQMTVDGGVTVQLPDNDATQVTGDDGGTLILPDDQATQMAVDGGATVQLSDDDATQVTGDDGGTLLLPDNRGGHVTGDRGVTVQPQNDDATQVAGDDRVTTQLESERLLSKSNLSAFEADTMAVDGDSAQVQNSAAPPDNAPTQVFTEATQLMKDDCSQTLVIPSTPEHISEMANASVTKSTPACDLDATQIFSDGSPILHVSQPPERPGETRLNQSPGSSDEEDIHDDPTQVYDPAGDSTFIFSQPDEPETPMLAVGKTPTRPGLHDTSGVSEFNPDGTSTQVMGRGEVPTLNLEATVTAADSDSDVEDGIERAPTVNTDLVCTQAYHMERDESMEDNDDDGSVQGVESATHQPTSCDLEDTQHYEVEEGPDNDTTDVRLGLSEHTATSQVNNGDSDATQAYSGGMDESDSFTVPSKPKAKKTAAKPPANSDDRDTQAYDMGEEPGADAVTSDDLSTQPYGGGHDDRVSAVFGRVYSRRTQQASPPKSYPVAGDDMETQAYDMDTEIVEDSQSDDGDVVSALTLPVLATPTSPAPSNQPQAPPLTASVTPSPPEPMLSGKSSPQEQAEETHVKEITHASAAKRGAVSSRGRRKTPTPPKKSPEKELVVDVKTTKRKARGVKSKSSDTANSAGTVEENRADDQTQKNVTEPSNSKRPGRGRRNYSSLETEDETEPQETSSVTQVPLGKMESDQSDKKVSVPSKSSRPRRGRRNDSSLETEDETEPNSTSSVTQLPVRKIKSEEETDSEPILSIRATNDGKDLSGGRNKRNLVRKIKTEQVEEVVLVTKQPDIAGAAHQVNDTSKVRTKRGRQSIKAEPVDITTDSTSVENVETAGSRREATKRNQDSKETPTDVKPSRRRSAVGEDKGSLESTSQSLLSPAEPAADDKKSTRSRKTTSKNSLKQSTSSVTAATGSVSCAGAVGDVEPSTSDPPQLAGRIVRQSRRTTAIRDSSVESSSSAASNTDVKPRRKPPSRKDTCDSSDSGSLPATPEDMSARKAGGRKAKGLKDSILSSQEITLAQVPIKSEAGTEVPRSRSRKASSRRGAAPDGSRDTAASQPTTSCEDTVKTHSSRRARARGTQSTQSPIQENVVICGVKEEAASECLSSSVGSSESDFKAPAARRARSRRETPSAGSTDTSQPAEPPGRTRRASSRSKGEDSKGEVAANRPSRARPIKTEEVDEMASVEESVDTVSLVKKGGKRQKTNAAKTDTGSAGRGGAVGGGANDASPNTPPTKRGGKRQKTPSSQQSTPCTSPSKKPRMNEPGTPRMSQAASAHLSPGTPSLRRKSLLPKPTVMFTGVIDEQGQKTVERLGGTLASSIHVCTHVVTDQVRRTVKFLCGLARGLPIVHPAWLERCQDASTFLDCSSHIIEDKASEGKYGFHLRASLETASKRPMLTGYKCYLTKNVQPEPDQMAEIIRCSGGEVLKRMPSKLEDNVVVISCDKDQTACQGALEAGLPVVGAEFLLLGVLRQEVDVEAHQLFAASVEVPAGGGRSKRGSQQTTATQGKKKRR